MTFNNRIEKVEYSVKSSSLMVTGKEYRLDMYFDPCFCKFCLTVQNYDYILGISKTVNFDKPSCVWYYFNYVGNNEQLTPVVYVDK